MANHVDALSQPEPEVLVATFSPEGGRVHLNDAWQYLLGGAGAWDRLADDDRQRAADAVAEAAAGSLVTNAFFFVDHPDEEEPLPLLLNFLPVYLPGAEAPRAITVTGEVLREPETWTQSQTQRNRMETLGRMTMGIAHDFNNLLSGILGYTELLKGRAEDADQDATLDEYLRTIEQAALDGAALIRKIQQYIRQEKHTHFEPVDLPTLIRDCITLTRPYWYNEPRREGIAIEVREEFETVPPVMGSGTELREVFINLILNAVQAMPQGGSLTFACGPHASGGVHVRVSDTGVGMDEEVRSHIFEPLYTTKGERGTGMGLAVSYGIIQEHDGTIDVRSTPGEGTSFHLAFPPADGAAPDTDEAAADRPNCAARVLVVDDEQMVRSVLGKLLALRGHDVHQAASGAEALRLVDRHTFDIVFTDHGMPEMNGRQLARLLRARFPALPIVLLTGDTDVGEPGGDVDLILAKPFRIDDLDATIHDLVAA